MNANWKNRLPLAIVAVVAVVALIASTHLQPVRAEGEGSGSSPGRYSVVETEAHNLIVTDN